MTGLKLYADDDKISSTSWGKKKVTRCLKTLGGAFTMNLMALNEPWTHRVHPSGNASAKYWGAGDPYSSTNFEWWDRAIPLNDTQKKRKSQIPRGLRKSQKLKLFRAIFFLFVFFIIVGMRFNGAEVTDGHQVLSQSFHPPKSCCCSTKWVVLCNLCNFLSFPPQWSRWWWKVDLPSRQ